MSPEIKEAITKWSMLALLYVVLTVTLVPALMLLFWIIFG